MRLSIPDLLNLKVENGEFDFDLGKGRIGFFGKELSPRPDPNFIGGAKRGEYHFHNAIRDRTVWAHVKNQKTSREVSNFLLDIDIEKISNGIQKCFTLVNPHNISKNLGSRIVKAWDMLDFTKAMLQELSYDDLEQVYGNSSEVPLRNLHTLARCAVGVDEGFMAFSVPHRVMLLDYGQINTIIADAFQPLTNYLSSSPIASDFSGFDYNEEIDSPFGLDDFRLRFF